MAAKDDKKRKTQKSAPAPQPTKKPKRIEAQGPADSPNRDRGPMVVGIGASAGGLAALRTFFRALPSSTGMSFVVITHLHPEHESHLAELLQKHTEMPTTQVVERVGVEPDHIYVIPPNRSILLTDTHLDTHEYLEPQDRRTPIDRFFRSMAASGHASPIAIILSGGGTDGSVGIKDVKEVGGLIMVQEPTEAEYDGMPHAALLTGLVDVVLPAARLAEKLAGYSQQRPRLPHDARQLTEAEAETLQRILGQVHARTGHDFAQYKRSTILRRVERRMQLNGFGTLEAYLAYLRGQPSESRAMFNDILIGVTSFFRDRESWDALSREIIPKLIQKAGGGDGIRIWSIGCASGEEAYGLAILCFEEAERQSVRPHLQIFASDLDERSIAHAREGVYPAAIEADLGPERLDRFFSREGEYYRVKRELREAVLFTNHNVMRDPPFLRQDLIVCRNVLIYLQRAVQERIFDILNYSLNPGGYVFLGTSESAEHLPELFNVVDKTHRLYQAKPSVGEKPHAPSMPITLQQGRRRSENYVAIRPRSPSFFEAPVIMHAEHQRALESYGPPSILVNARNLILHVSENAGRYLRQPKGPVTADLLTLVRPELQLELRMALFHAFEKGRATASRPVIVEINGHRRRVVVSVRLKGDYAGSEKTTEKQVLVFFLEDEVDSLDETTDAIKPRTPGEQDQLIAELQSEIQRLREQLQLTVEEYESFNEELQSINEEYRSATEELETSKEELQSMNEELQTVNSEMRSKVDETSRAHQELENLMGATEIATLYLDRELRIQRFTAGVQELFSMLQVDRGRHIGDLTHRLGYTEFVEDAEQALHQLAIVEREVLTPDGNWFLIRQRPYRTLDSGIEGVAITFIDINQLKATEGELIQARDLLEVRVQERTRDLDTANQKISLARDLFLALFSANPIPTALVRVEDGVLLDVNIEFLNYFGFQPEQATGRQAEQLSIDLGLSTEARAYLRQAIQEEGRARDFEAQIVHPSGELRNILTSVQLIEVEDTKALIAAFTDITDRVRAEQQIRALASELTATEQAERHHLSQILHDDLQQRIFAIQMQLSFLRDAYERNDLRAFEVDFPQLEEWLTEAIRVTRQLSVDLSPPILHGEGLQDAVVWLASQMDEQYGLKVNIQSSGTPVELEEKIRVLVFYAVRELLFNIVKHAGTTEAAVRFEHLTSHLLVVVSDRGSGFDSTAAMNDPTRAHGLLVIRHRLHLLGCTLEVKSQPGSGTEAIITVPCEQRDTSS